MESKLEKTLTKVSRLQQVISNLKDIKVLIKEETEKAAKSIQIKPFTPGKQQMYSPSNTVRPSGIDWSFPSNFAFDPGLLTDLGIPKNIKTPPNIQSNS